MRRRGQAWVFELPADAPLVSACQVKNLLPAHRWVPPYLSFDEVQRCRTGGLVGHAGDEVASAALSLMQRGRVIEIDLSLALEASPLGLPLADSLIYATARRHGAVWWTQVGHFEGLSGVQYFSKP